MQDESAVPLHCHDVVEELSPVARAAWGGFLRAYATIVRQLDAALMAEHNLSLSSLDVLSKLAAAPRGRLRMTELAQSVCLSPSGLTRLVDRLEHEQLIERHHCEHDGRGLYAAISERGRAKFQAAQVSHLAQVREQFLSKFSEAELAQLGAFWERLAPSISPSLKKGDDEPFSR
ncbi:MAG: MarR family transcriptional regulator [Chloroflexi bacterium]|nr:MarR family transcriptional regulator [Chloroflexota bacterium]